MPMIEHPRAEWFQVQALECIGLALRAKDPRIKRLYALEADRWLRLAELKLDSVIRNGRLTPAEYQGVERRMTRSSIAPDGEGVLTVAHVAPRGGHNGR
jgi:hypothetical protein